MHKRHVLSYIVSLLLFIPSVLYSQILPPAHAFTPFASAATFSSGKGYSLDDNGILLYDYGSRYGSVGKYHNPTFIAAYANALYRDFLAGDKQAKLNFLRQTDYLISSSNEDTTGIYWVFPFVNEHFSAPVNWYSAMTSGRILGLLVRAHALTGEDRYLNTAVKVMKKLTLARQLGGMTTYCDDGTAWLEEYVYPGCDSFKVLNGHIFALAGVYDYVQYTGNKDASIFLDKCINAVKENLDLFDAGYLSFYSEKRPGDKPRFFAERGGYNIIHIQQLLWLYKITNQECFVKKASSFQSYENNYPDISVSHSTNSITHGPDRMNLTFGTSYWSSSEFPVTITLKLKRVQLLKGIVLLGHTFKSSPKKYYIESSLDNRNWKGLASQVENEQLRKKILFTYFVKACYVRITIYSDNGNGNVALDGVGLLYKKTSSPVTNFSNYSVGVKKLEDGDITTGVKIKDDGWIIFDSKGAKTIALYGSFYSPMNSSEDYVIEGSNDLIHWRECNAALTVLPTNIRLDLAQKKFAYYRLSFMKKFVDQVTELEYM